MKKLFLIYLALAVGVKAKKNEQNPPTMTWIDCNDHLRCLEVNFHDGKPNDVAQLNPAFQGKDCILQGHFKYEETRVAVTTNCPFDPAQDFKVSLASPRSPNMAFFHVQDGKTDVVHVNMNQYSNDFISIPTHDDHLLDDDRLPRNSSVSYPSNGFYIIANIYYDDKFLNKWGSGAEGLIQRGINHANTVFQWPSLDAKMTIYVVSIQHLSGLSFEATGDWLNYLGAYYPADGVNLNIFVTDNGQSFDGIGGIAFGSSICSPSAAQRINIIEFGQHDYDDFYSGTVIAHETGHNLGMLHDFVGQYQPRYCRAGQACTGIGAIMEGATERTKWSCCSNDDFKDYYDPRQSNWCLQTV